MAEQLEKRKAVFIKKDGLYFGAWHVHPSPFCMSFVQIA
jgi:hypothetical protein